MTKKDFIALADAIRVHNRIASHELNSPFAQWHIEALADFCQSSNAAFNRARWLGYIAGENGRNGGKVKAS